MSSSTHSPRFLLDENVRIELSRFLDSQGFDVKLAPKSSSDSLIASFSDKEKRVLVTNDEDFCAYTERDIFAVILLRIPQNDPAALLAAFKKLLSTTVDLPGHLVLLQTASWSIHPHPLPLP
ncbi:MAG: DUF5615 family PIN-like protein [Elusimicrobia bacterium]|nr:DUF5615 family PIN-like protein [Candidatus Obscuribacterium magneticum]